MTKPKRYKRYSAEFKKEAIKRAGVSGTALGPSPCLARYVFQVGLLMSLGLAVSNVA